MNGLLQEEDVVAVVDMEAGLEHLSRGTEQGVDLLLVVFEPYYKALEIGRRAVELGLELGVSKVLGVANKVRDEVDGEAIEDYASRHAIEILGTIPWDETVRKLDLAGRAPFDSPDTPAVQAIADLATSLGFRATRNPYGPART